VTDQTAELGQLLSAYRISQALHVAAVLGIADLLADGPRGAGELAEASGSDPDTLYRLLRALASVGVFAELEGRRFASTPLGDGLRSDAPGSLRAMAVVLGTPYLWDAWGELLHSVRTGENAFRHLHGMSVWDFRVEHPEDGVAFDEWMTAQTARIDASLLDAFDFGRFGLVADVGGGRGALLATLLSACPEMRGILFDQPHVVAGAASPLEAAGVADRCELVGGSFFDAVPEGADAYILKWIIHDWEDGEATAILRSCRQAMPDHGRLLMIERILGPPNARPEAKFMDLHMLVGPGGRERSHEEYDALLGAAGFELEGFTPTSSGFDVIEASPS
jgi:hypothetical protein